MTFSVSGPDSSVVMKNPSSTINHRLQKMKNKHQLESYIKLQVLRNCVSKTFRSSLIMASWVEAAPPSAASFGKCAFSSNYISSASVSLKTATKGLG